MPTVTTLKPAAPWTEIRTTEADWDAADPSLLGTMLTQLHLIRAFEETVLELAGEGLVHGPAHSSIGQEGGAVASIVGLRPSDQVNGSHRGHHQFLAKALTYLAPDGFDPAAEIGGDTQGLLQKTLAEILGLAQGFCRGRGGSMHLRWTEAGVLGTNAIVGGGVPMAAGAAWCHRRAGTGDVVVTYFGDGAVNIGSVLETMNLAGTWKLPICFFIENNRYAVATTVDEATGEPRLSARGQAFNIPAWRVDGMDPLAVHLATTAALDHMRAGNGPAIVEAEVYRYFHQNGPLPGSAFGYRTKQEEASWRARDPLDRLAREMIARGLVDRRAVDTLRTRAQEAMRQAAGALTEPDGNRRRIQPSLWPEAGFRDVRHPRRPERAEGGAHGRAGDLHRRGQGSEVHRRGRRRDAPPDERGRPHHRAGRRHPPAARRHQRRHARPQRRLPRSRPRHADQRERLCRVRRWPGHGRPLPAGRRIHVPGFHVGRGRPGLQPDRQGPAHVRRRLRHAPGAAHQGGDGHRLRHAALDGSGRHLCDVARLAHPGAVDALRLCRSDEQRG